MPTFRSIDLIVNTSFDGVAPDATLTVTNDSSVPNGAMKPGTYTFQLEVEDNSKNRSKPVTFQLTILDTQAPTAIISGLDKVEFGKDFVLSGAKSVDVGGGTIARYIWTRIQ